METTDVGAKEGWYCHTVCIRRAFIVMWVITKERSIKHQVHAYYEYSLPVVKQLVNVVRIRQAYMFNMDKCVKGQYKPEIFPKTILITDAFSFVNSFHIEKFAL